MALPPPHRYDRQVGHQGRVQTLSDVRWQRRAVQDILALTGQVTWIHDGPITLKCPQTPPLRTAIGLSVVCFGLIAIVQRQVARGESKHEPPVVFDGEFLVDPALVPEMRLPFDSGVAVLCSQGNASEPGMTHSLAQNRHALDFSNRILPEVMAVAAADGTVVYVARDVGDGPDAGGGYGNQVRILHGHRLFTLYAHLEQVLVNVGQRVLAGQRLGTLGHTGAAGDRHLHFSLHTGTYSEEGVPPTLEIPKIGTSCGTLSSVEFKCGSRADPWSGDVYAPPVSPEFEETTATALRELDEAVSVRSRLRRYSNANPVVTVTFARSFLKPYLEQAPMDPIVQYAWAVEVEMPQRRYQAAEEHIRIAERAIMNPALYEPWIEAWIENQRGAIALERSQIAEADAHFARAWSLLPTSVIREFAERQKQVHPIF